MHLVFSLITDTIRQHIRHNIWLIEPVNALSVFSIVKQIIVKLTPVSCIKHKSSCYMPLMSISAHIHTMVTKLISSCHVTSISLSLTLSPLQILALLILSGFHDWAKPGTRAESHQTKFPRRAGANRTGDGNTLDRERGRAIGVLPTVRRSGEWGQRSELRCPWTGRWVRYDVTNRVLIDNGCNLQMKLLRRRKVTTLRNSCPTSFPGRRKFVGKISKFFSTHLAVSLSGTSWRTIIKPWPDCHNRFRRVSIRWRR